MDFMVARTAKSIIGLTVLASAPLLLMLSIGPRLSEATSMLLFGVALLVGGQVLRSALSHDSEPKTSATLDRVLSNPS
jgi:hypothetical protein